MHYCTEDAICFYPVVITVLSYARHPATEIQFGFYTMMYGVKLNLT